jgi:hypothetical protein
MQSLGVSIDALLASLGNTWHPKQAQANRLSNERRFALFGGTRGPGKSRWLRWRLVWLHLWWAQEGFRNVRTMLACEDYPSLYDRQAVKILTEFPAALGEYQAGRSEFHFRPIVEFPIAGHVRPYPLGGAICLRNLDDPSKYQSAEYAAIAVDELTRNKRRNLLDNLRSSLRWPGLGSSRIPPRFFAATNPTGEGLSWVRGLWIEKDMPAEYADIRDEFVYIPGRPADNPSLADDYWVMLRTLPEPLRSAWLEGDWYTGVEGAIFPNWSGAAGGNVTEEADYQPGVGPVEWGLDDGYATEHPMVILFAQIRSDGTICIFDEYVHSLIQHDRAFREARDMGWPEPQVADIPSEAQRLMGVLHSDEFSIHTRMSTHRIEDGVKVLRDLICNGAGVRKLLIHPRCRMTIQSVASLPEDPARNGRPLKINGVPGDHPADALRYLCWWHRLRDL